MTAVRAKVWDIRFGDVVLKLWCITAHQSCNLRHLAQASSYASRIRISTWWLGIKALSSNHRQLNDVHRLIPDTQNSSDGVLQSKAVERSRPWAIQLVQQSLRAINKKWQSAENCQRAVLATGHSVLVTFV
jgi:hypothetical protein